MIISKADLASLLNASRSTYPSVRYWLNASLAGTQTGLAKMPYLRDTRRSAGGVPRNFRIFKNNLTQPGNWSKAAVAWPDTIGIGCVSARAR